LRWVAERTALRSGARPPTRRVRKLDSLLTLFSPHHGDYTNKVGALKVA
jgi:hypothetical protein